MKYLLIVIYIILTTSGLFCFKSGGEFALTLKNGINFQMTFMTFFGFAFYLCSFLLWQKLISTYDLSYIVPIATALVQVISVMFGYFFFKETISMVNTVGIIFIILGVVLLSIKG